MVHGAEKLGRLLALTLGPVQGHVLVARDMKSTPYETLTDAATIARRIIALPDPLEDAGAMMLRHCVWRVRETVGDGSATAAVIVLSLLKEARRYVAAGANPMQIRRGVELGLEAATQALKDVSMPLESRAQYRALALAVCDDAELADVIAEIYDTLGADATIYVEDYVARYIDREYIEGARFRAGYSSRSFTSDGTARPVDMENPLIFVSDWLLQEPRQIQPVLELARSQGEGRPLVVVSANQTDKALTTLLGNNATGALPCCGVTAKGVGDEMRTTLQDLALVSGGAFFPREAEMTVGDLKLSDFGQAGRIKITEDTVTVFQGAGDAKAVRRQRQQVRRQLGEAESAEAADVLRQRLAHLASGIAILKIGASSEQERTALHKQAEEAVRVVGQSFRDGLAPGGGAAFLACEPAVRAVPAEGDVALGVAALAHALQAPLRQIARNAGLNDNLAVARCQEKGPGYGIDARSGEVVDMVEAGIADSRQVLQTALEAGASTANMLLTNGALVLHKKPQVQTEP